MPLVVSDKFVSGVLGPALIALFGALAFPLTLVACVLFQTGLFSEAESSPTLRLIDILSWFRSPPGVVGGLILQVLPAFVAAICLSSDQTSLTWPGRVVFLITLYILGAAVILLFLIKPNSAAQSENVSGGKETLDLLLSIANYSLSTALVYLGLLTGLSVKVTKN